jgi:hypothetical protein
MPTFEDYCTECGSILESHGQEQCARAQYAAELENAAATLESASSTLAVGQPTMLRDWDDATREAGKILVSAWLRIQQAYSDIEAAPRRFTPKPTNPLDSDEVPF